MARGISTGGDVIRSTVDGVDVNTIWREFVAALQLANDNRDNVRAMLSFSTTAAGDEIPQTTSLEDFEVASEFGKPKSIRGQDAFLRLGFDFDWYDARTSYTWRFLADADRGQVEAVHARVLEADNRLVFRETFKPILNNTAKVNPEGLPIFPLYNGDGTAPPAWNGMVFDGSHTHYLVSGSATFDGGDISDAYKQVAHHGYGDTSVGGRVLAFMNPREGELARQFRQDRANLTINPYDFIPSTDAPAYLSAEEIVGTRAPARFGRIPIFGSYGPVWLTESALVPPGYVVAIATYGPNDRRNPVAVREHNRPDLRGLRQIPGGNEKYPLQDSYYSRGFGTGIRHRGGAAVVQVKAAGTYDVPAQYA